MDWIGMTEDRDQWRGLLSTVTNIWVSYNSGKFLRNCTIVGFSRKAQLHEVFYIIITWLVRLLALRPLLAYSASLG
jgi:hypothetical protein